MIKGFEDAFMDAQSSAVSLCIELLEYSNVYVEKIYIYMFQNEIQDFFNVFFERNGSLYRLDELFSDEQIDEFLSCGIDDIENIIEVCNKYDGKCPNELRLVYNIKTKMLDAEYAYEDFVSEKDGGLVGRFEYWFNECKNKL